MGGSGLDPAEHGESMPAPCSAAEQGPEKSMKGSSSMSGAGREVRTMVLVPRGRGGRVAGLMCSVVVAATVMDRLASCCPSESCFFFGGFWLQAEVPARSSSLESAARLESPQCVLCGQGEGGQDASKWGGCSVVLSWGTVCRISKRRHHAATDSRRALVIALALQQHCSPHVQLRQQNAMCHHVSFTRSKRAASAECRRCLPSCTRAVAAAEYRVIRWQQRHV